MTNAYQLIPSIQKIKQEFEKESSVLIKFDCLQNFEHYFDNRLEILKTDVRQGLEQIFIEFDEKKFRSYIICHYMFEIYSPCENSLTDEISDILRKSVKLAKHKVIETFIQSKIITVRKYVSLI